MVSLYYNRIYVYIFLLHKTVVIRLQNDNIVNEIYNLRSAYIIVCMLKLLKIVCRALELFI